MNGPADVPVTTTPSIMATTTAALVAQHAAADPDALFLIAVDESQPAREITYAEQWARVQRTAATLAGLGVRRGDRVHLQAGNCPEFYDVWFATSLLGAAMVPTNPLSTVDELRHVLIDAHPAVSLAPADVLPQVREASAGLSGLRMLALDGDDMHSSATSSISCAASAVPQPCAIAEHDVAAILYTSGTTSRPKGVQVTHSNYAAVGGAVARHLHIAASDRWLVALPLFHANAQYYCTMSALVTGASIVLAARFSASGWAHQAAVHGATLGSLFAAPIRMILANEPDPIERENSLRAVVFAQNLTDEQAAGFERRFGTRLLQLYGMTETVLPPTMNPDSEHRRWDSIGQPLADVELAILDERDQPVPVGAVGELCVGGDPGHTIAAGYYRRPEATAETFADGWLHTGDLVHAGRDGFVYFVDRAKDMIKRSGENVAASEVERVINEYPGVAESAAVGVPDPVRDEAIVAYVVLKPDDPASEDQLLAWCRARLAHFKVPDRCRFLKALPRTSVGKIRKQALRATATPPPTTDAPNPHGPGHTQPVERTDDRATDHVSTSSVGENSAR